MVCPICRRSGVRFTSDTLPAADATLCHCDACGSFEVTGEFRDAEIANGLAVDDRLRLSGAIRRVTDGGGRLSIRPNNYTDIIAEEHLPDLAEGHGRGHSTKWGTMLRSKRDAVIGGKRIVSPGTKSGAARWRLVPVNPK